MTKAYNEIICKKMLNLAAFRYSDTVLSYSPLKGEVDITPFNQAVLESGKRLALPRCIPGSPIMEFRYVDSLEELQSGAYSIKEPTKENELWINKGHGSTLCVVPAMAFDREGYRLGYGKGYYDRFLSSKNLTRLGVAYSEFIVDKLPRGHFDLAVDVIVTESSLISLKK